MSFVKELTADTLTRSVSEQAISYIGTELTHSHEGNYERNF